MKKYSKLLIILIILFSIMNFSCMSAPEDGWDVATMFLDGTMSVLNVAESVADTAQAYDMTPTETYAMGKTVAAELVGNYHLYYNEDLYLYLNYICMTLAIHENGKAPYKGYKVGVLNTDIINAFSTPSGHILLTRGLLNTVNSEDELAAVIAHELSHVMLEHSIKAIKKNSATQTVGVVTTELAAMALSGLNAGDYDKEAYRRFTTSVNSMTETLVTEGYSKENEFDADKNGVYLLEAAGYNPEAMVGMLENLKKCSSKKYKMGFGKTHPSPGNRILEVSYEIPAKTGNYYEESRVDRFNKYQALF